MIRTKRYAELLAAIPQQPTSQATDVYRFYDRGGTLLYVGVSGNLVRRLDEHRDRKRWWPRVARVEVTHCDSRQAALFHEFVTIQQLQPLFNVQGQTAERPPDWQFIVAAINRLQKLPEADDIRWPADEHEMAAAEDDMEFLATFVEEASATWQAHREEAGL